MNSPKKRKRVKVSIQRRMIVQEEIPSVWERINRVLIPGSTGGLYTIFSGAMLILVTTGVYVFAFSTGRAIPGQFNDLLYSAVGLLTIHAGRSVLGGRNVAQMTKESIRGVDSGEHIEISTPDGTIRAEKSNNTPDIDDDADYIPDPFGDGDDDYKKIKG